jgi:hypothetical protein
MLIIIRRNNNRRAWKLVMVEGSCLIREDHMLLMMEVENIEWNSDSIGFRIRIGIGIETEQEIKANVLVLPFLSIRDTHWQKSSNNRSIGRSQGDT